MRATHRASQLLFFSKFGSGFFNLAAMTSADTSTIKIVFLVDDEILVRDIARQMLSIFGISVVSAATAAEALTLFRQGGGAFSSVLIDLKLPDMDGVELSNHLLTMRPDASISLMSGDPGEFEERAAGRGFRFLKKPFSMGELLEHVAGGRAQKQLGAAD